MRAVGRRAHARSCVRSGMRMMITFGFRFEIDRKSVQRIVPPNTSERFEGIDFSRSGRIMAIATSETNSVLLFKRKPDGRFEDPPFRTIGRFAYLHYGSFSSTDVTT